MKTIFAFGCRIFLLRKSGLLGQTPPTKLFVAFDKSLKLRATIYCLENRVIGERIALRVNFHLEFPQWGICICGVEGEFNLFCLLYWIDSLFKTSINTYFITNYHIATSKNIPARSQLCKDIRLGKLEKILIYIYVCLCHREHVFSGIHHISLYMFIALSTHCMALRKYGEAPMCFGVVYRFSASIFPAFDEDNQNQAREKRNYPSKWIIGW